MTKQITPEEQEKIVAFPGSDAEYQEALGEERAEEGHPVDVSGDEGPQEPSMSEIDALAMAEAVLNGPETEANGNVTVDDIVAAFGAATLRAQKAEQQIFVLQNENQRLRTTLRNVIRSKKATKKS